MGMIINIDKALELRTDYNVLREPLNDMLKAQQEAWEKKNPIDLLFVRNSIDRFQQTSDHIFSIGNGKYSDDRLRAVAVGRKYRI